MARQRRRRRRAAAPDRGLAIGGVLLGLVAVAVLAAIGWFYAHADRPPPLDRTTFCPVAGPRAVTVVLLDSSDALPEIARKEVTTMLVDAAGQVPTYGLLEVRVLDPAAPGGRVLFSRCNPGNGEGLSEFTANPAMARKRWMESFSQPLDTALRGGLEPESSATSPLMATIQAIAVDRFTGASVASAPKSLIIVSDMIEHGPDYSQYQGDLSYARFKSSKAYRKVRTDLAGASVTIDYVQRQTAHPLNSADHIRFWTDWVQDNNGRVVSATKLQGLG
jgi:hypothetical protein